MLKKFQNDFTKWDTKKNGVIFHVGDKVISGRTKGAIVAIAANGDFLLSNDAVVFADNVKHAPTVIQETKTVVPTPEIEVIPEPSTAKPTVSKSRRTKDDCEAEIARLNRKLEECNVERNLPAVVVQAPIEVQKSLPEFRKAELMSEIQEATVLLTENVRSGSQAEVKQTEKLIAKSFEELKEVSPQVTISASGGCRVVQGKAHGKDTIRIYFAQEQDKNIKDLVMKMGFRWYQEKVKGITNKYWGAWYSDKLLAFAKELCSSERDVEEVPPTIIKGDVESNYKLLAKKLNGVGRTLEKDKHKYSFIEFPLQGNYFRFSVNGSAKIQIESEPTINGKVYLLTLNEIKQAIEVVKSAIEQIGLNIHDFVHLNEIKYLGHPTKPKEKTESPKLIHSPSGFLGEIVKIKQKDLPIKDRGLAKFEDIYYFVESHEKKVGIYHLKSLDAYNPFESGDVFAPDIIATEQERKHFTSVDLSEVIRHYQKSKRFIPFLIDLGKKDGERYIDNEDLYAKTTVKTPEKEKSVVATDLTKNTDYSPDYFLQQIALILKAEYIKSDNARRIKFTIAGKKMIEPRQSVYISFAGNGSYSGFLEKDSRRLTSEQNKHIESMVQSAMERLGITQSDLAIKSENITESPKTETPKSSTSKITLSPLLKELMPKHQQRYLEEVRGDGVKDLKPAVEDLEQQIATIKQRQSGKQAIVKAHYFYGGSDWYVTEYEGNGIVYGFAILNGDYEYSEFGSASIAEFNQTGKVEMDFYWTPKPLDEILYKKNSKYYPLPKSMEKKTTPSVGHPSKGGEFEGKATPTPETKKSSNDDKQGEDVLKTIRETMERIAAAAQARIIQEN